MKLSFYILFIMTCFCISNIEAGFTNNGRMQGNNLNLSIGGTLDNNGQLIGFESANLKCDTLSGNGLIQSPKIIINTKIFAYTGTIDCDGECMIVASTPFDETMFTRTGDGEFTIFIEEDAVKSLSSSYVISDQLAMHID